MIPGWKSHSPGPDAGSTRKRGLAPRDMVLKVLQILGIGSVLVMVPVVMAYVMFFRLPWQSGYDPTRDSIETEGLGYPQSMPQWSPDGSLIVFTRYSSLFVVSADGSHVRQIRERIGDRFNFFAHSPSISPDGSRMAFTAFEHDTWLPWSKDHQWEIVTSALDGSDERRITKTGNRRILNLHPAWSPDGTRIAFVSNRASDARAGRHGIFTMAPDGSDVRSVAPSIRAKGTLIVWSPDGRSLAFVVSEPGEGFHVYKDVLYTVASDGSALTRIGEATSQPAWSPDGSRIAFLRTDTDSTALYTIAPDGSNLTKVLESSDEYLFPFGNPMWSPDGTRILLSGPLVGVVNSDGSGRRLLTEVSIGESYASWSHDGSRIAVSVPRSGSGTAPVALTMAPDGSDKRVLVRHIAGQGLEAGQGEPWPPKFKLPPIPTPIPFSTNGSPDAPATQQEPTLTRALAPTSEPAPVQDRRAPRDVSRFDPFSAGSGAAYGHGEASSVEGVLEKGLHLMEASPVHVAVRGTAQADSVRCDWHGVARTAQQREEAIRFWLGKDDDEPLPSATEVEAEFMAYINRMDPRYQDSVAASFLPVARGGLSTEHLTLACFADYTIHEYLLGNGTSTLMVAYDDVGRARSYDLYSRSHAAGEFGAATSTPLMSGAEYQKYLNQMVWDTESSLAEMVEGYEGVVFLAPMGAHNAIAVEVWQAVAQWDVQTDDDGTVNAVRYGASQYDPEYSQPLTELEERVETAAEEDEFAGERIESVEELDDYYEEIGAYDDITPDDDDTTTFRPDDPPPVPLCANGTAIPDPGDNRPLVHDCEVLLDVKDMLAGTATLNWSADTAITEWNGITVSSAPSRVTELDLNTRGLTGTIPAELGNLANLTYLNLSVNRLSGEIPSELGSLENLKYLTVATNQLKGKIPAELGSLANLTHLILNNNHLSGDIPGWLGRLTNLETLSLANNQLNGDIPAELAELANLTYLELSNNQLSRNIPAWLGRLTNLETLSLSSNQLSGDIPAWLGRLTHLETLGLAGNQLTGCIPLALESVATNDLTALGLSYCISVEVDNPNPAAGQSISLSVSVPGAVSHQWQTHTDGTWTDMSNSTEAAATVTLEESGTRSYRVIVVHGSGVTSTSSDVSVTWIHACTVGVAVTNPDGNPGLVSDCEALLEARDTLAGTAALDWSGDTAVADWEGVTVDGDPSRVTQLNLAHKGLTGTIAPSLGELSALSVLSLNHNSLTGSIPPELGDLSALTSLSLNSNGLTGGIPAQLGNMSILQRLWLKNNPLGGTIPPDLGNLTDLRELVLNLNELTGTIPLELGDLEELQDLRLSGNQLTGCIPSALQDVANNDLDKLGLPFCGAGVGLKHSP